MMGKGRRLSNNEEGGKGGDYGLHLNNCGY
jgi:hypothetical protein